jgi:hypothetical protein
VPTPKKKDNLRLNSSVPARHRRLHPPTYPPPPPPSPTALAFVGVWQRRHRLEVADRILKARSPGDYSPPSISIRLPVPPPDPSNAPPGGSGAGADGGAAPADPAEKSVFDQLREKLGKNARRLGGDRWYKVAPHTPSPACCVLRPSAACEAPRAARCRQRPRPLSLITARVAAQFGGAAVQLRLSCALQLPIATNPCALCRWSMWGRLGRTQAGSSETGPRRRPPACPPAPAQLHRAAGARRRHAAHLPLCAGVRGTPLSPLLVACS